LIKSDLEEKNMDDIPNVDHVDNGIKEKHKEIDKNKTILNKEGKT
jgi:hypothetical protein